MWLCCPNTVLPVSQSFTRMFPLTYVPLIQRLLEEAHCSFHFYHTWEYKESLEFLTKGGNCSLPLSLKLFFFMSNLFNVLLLEILKVIFT